MRFRFDRSLSLHVVSPLTLLCGNRPAIPILMYHSIEHEQQPRVHPYYRTTTPPRYLMSSYDFYSGKVTRAAAWNTP